MMTGQELICDPPYMIKRETGEVIDICVEPNDTTQDKDLDHYSVTPPVPYVPQKFVDKMKEYDKWLKGKEKFIELLNKFNKKIKYIKELVDN